MTAFGDAPASFYDLATANARDEFAVRPLNPWVGDALDPLLATAARAAMWEIPELQRRFEADWEPFVARIHAIDQPTAREVRGDALLAATMGLRVIKGGMAA